MLIARCVPPKIDKRHYPRRSSDVETGNYFPEYKIFSSEPKTIGCYSVPPHTDENYRNCYFVLLVLEGSHCLGDAKEYPREAKLRRGSLAIIDPYVLHWLLRESMEKRMFWVALDWQVPRRRLKQYVHKIVETFNGEWARPYEAGRYAKLIPSIASSQ